MYAHVPATITDFLGESIALRLNPSGNKIGTYGLEACGSSTTGISAAKWNCDGTQWYRGNCDPNLGYSCSTQINGQQTDISIRPNGNTGLNTNHYELRDIDCYDNSAMVVRSVASWGTLTGTSCQ